MITGGVSSKRICVDSSGLTFLLAGDGDSSGDSLELEREVPLEDGKATMPAGLPPSAVLHGREVSMYLI